MEKIEELLTDLDAGVAALERVQQKLTRYRSAVLKAAVEGKLTEAWRVEHPDVEPAEKLLERILVERRKRRITDQLEKWRTKQADKGWDKKRIAEKEPAERKKIEAKYKRPVEPDSTSLPDLPLAWCWVSSDTFFWFVTSGSRGWAKYYAESGPAFLRVGNLDHYSITLDLREVQRVTPPQGAEQERTRVLASDILVSVTADVGMIAVVPEDFEEAYTNQHVAIARPVKAIHVPYVAWYLAAQHGGQMQFRKLQRGATKIGLGLDDIRSVAISMPPLVEQEMIAAIIEERLSTIEAAEQAIEKQLQRAARLRQSILKRAFEGKLVPQDPSDEPAERLLARIRAERQAQAAAETKTKPKPRRPRRKAARRRK